jgi:hypothetical protein
LGDSRTQGSFRNTGPAHRPVARAIRRSCSTSSSVPEDLRACPFVRRHPPGVGAYESQSPPRRVVRAPRERRERLQSAPMTGTRRLQPLTRAQCTPLRGHSGTLAQASVVSPVATGSYFLPWRCEYGGEEAREAVSLVCRAHRRRNRRGRLCLDRGVHGEALTYELRAGRRRSYHRADLRLRDRRDRWLRIVALLPLDLIGATHSVNDPAYAPAWCHENSHQATSRQGSFRNTGPSETWVRKLRR